MNLKKNDIIFFDYEIIIKKKDNKFFGYIPDLSLYSSATNSELVINDLEKKFNELLKHYEETESIHLIKNTKKKKRNELFKYELSLFSIKFLFISFVGLIFFILVGTFLANKFQQISVVDVLSSETKKISRLVDSHIIKNINNKENVETFKNFLLQIKPYIDVFEEISTKEK